MWASSETALYANLAADPRASVLIFDPEDPFYVVRRMHRPAPTPDQRMPED